MEKTFFEYRSHSGENSEDLFDDDSDDDFQKPLISSTVRKSKNESLNFSLDETNLENDLDNSSQNNEKSIASTKSSTSNENISKNDETSDDDSFLKNVVASRRKKPILLSDDENSENEKEYNENKSDKSSKKDISLEETEISDDDGILKNLVVSSRKEPILSDDEEKGENEKQYNISESDNSSINDISPEATESEKVLADDTEVQILSQQLSDPVVLSSDDEQNNQNTSLAILTPIKVQPKINAIFPKKESPALNQVPKQIFCTPAEMENQKQKVQSLTTSLRQVENILKTFNLDNLPDRGKQLNNRKGTLTVELEVEQEKLRNMVIDPDKVNKPALVGQNMPSWKNFQVLSNQVQPGGFGGKQAMETYQSQKMSIMETLKKLHQSFETRPTEDAEIEDPKGLKVELMQHQKQALAFLLWRESQKPSGGILADDMGLGKTLTMISLIIKSNELNVQKNETDSDDSDIENQNDFRNKRREHYPGGTLVICPASLVEQWENEVKKHCRRNMLDVELYHGPNRELKSRRLAKHDIVITTYNLVSRERECSDRLFGVKWKRIILDEAHIVRNYKSQSSLGVCALKGKYRWCLTGTPVHNKEIDLFALLKFLKCAPFDDLAVWKKWIDNKSTGGQERLDIIIQSLMLRRTKIKLQELGTFALPSKQTEIINVTLSKEETKIYQKILIFSKTLFAQFLHQRAEKNTDLMYSRESDSRFMNSNPNSEYEKIQKHLLRRNGGQQVKAHQILVLILRLRQICCHPSLIRTMLENEACEGIEDADGNDIDLLEQIENLNINDENDINESQQVQEQEADKLGAAASKIIDYKEIIFDSKSMSSKIKILINTLKEKVINQNDKAIIVSQWTSMLEIIELHLKRENIKCVTLSGSVPVPKRMELVDSFNKSSSSLQVMLLSLTAGGVGLNLVGANHLLLVDLHWNPQLEAQAQDRIYRVGQTKTVNIYKFVTLDTIEERIKALQDQKLEMASNVLTGSKQNGGNKLTIEDMKTLFDI